MEAVNMVLQSIQNPLQKQIYANLAKDIPFDVVLFANKLGIFVKETSELPDTTSGFIQLKDSKVFIFVNELHHINRKRFTVAHELGHYFLHYDRLQDGIVDSVLKRQDGINDAIEREANKFAAELLMPTNIFIEIWNMGRYSVSDMAKILLVSESAVMIRAKSLGLARNDGEYFV